MQRTKVAGKTVLEDAPKKSDPLLIELEKGLKIDENALEEVLQQQADLFYRVAKELALRISLRDQAKQELAEIEAEADIDLRKDARVNEEKITEKEIEAKKKLDTKVQRASDRFLKLTLQVGQWGALKDAYIQRSYVLKDMVALYLRSYYADSSIGSAQRNHSDTVGMEARRAMSERRRSSNDRNTD
jgi:hypothetical protein